MKGITLKVAIGALIGIASMAANAAVCEVVQAACVLPSDDVASRATVQLITCSATLIADPDGTTQTSRFVTAAHCVDHRQPEEGETYQGDVSWRAVGDCGAPDEPAESAASPYWAEETIRVIALDGLNDLALVEIDRLAPAGAYFAAWDARQISKDAWVGMQVDAVHHAEGYVQQYATATATRADNSDGSTDPSQPAGAVSVQLTDGLMGGGASGSGWYGPGRSLLATHSGSNKVINGDTGECTGVIAGIRPIANLAGLISYMGADHAEGYESTAVVAVIPTVDLSSSSDSVDEGESFRLGWATSNAASCTLQGTGVGSGAVPTAGSKDVIVNDSGEYDYSLVCESETGDVASDSVLVVVNEVVIPDPAPTLDLTISKASIKLGDSSTLTWSSADATSCTASGSWSGDQDLSGSQAITPSSTGSFSYALLCSGPGGDVTKTVSLTVNPAPVTGGETGGGGDGGGSGGALSLWSLIPLLGLAAIRRRGRLGSLACG